MVEHEDVVLAVMGAQAALGALVLVFLGLLLGVLGDFDAETPGAILRPYRVVAGETLGAFVCSVISMGMCLWWLIGGQPSWTYAAAIITFVAVLGLLLASALWVGWKFLVGT
jgi:hypothetical protein